jgi:hypothetical protein
MAKRRKDQQLHPWSLYWACWILSQLREPLPTLPSTPPRQMLLQCERLTLFRRQKQCSEKLSQRTPGLTKNLRIHPSPSLALCPAIGLDPKLKASPMLDGSAPMHPRPGLATITASGYKAIPCQFKGSSKPPHSGIKPLTSTDSRRRRRCQCHATT